MAKNILGVCLLSVALLFVTLPADKGYGATQTPEQFVKEFYQWYFKTDAQSPAILHDGMFKYFSQKTVEYIRSKKGSNEDYMTKANSWIPEWEEVKVTVGKALTLSDDSFVVPVTFHADEAYHVVVFVGKENKKMRIIKITDTYPYS